MIPLLDNILPSRHIINAAITTAQKVVFVLYIAVCLWSGSLMDTFNEILMPRKPDVRWVPFFLGSSELEGCDSFLRIYTKPRCIRALFLQDEADLYQSATNLSKCSKWQYLLIMRTFRLVSPFVFQISLFLIPTVGFVFQASLMRKLLLFIGYDTLWRRARLGFHHLSSRTRFQRNKLEDLIYLGLGFTLASFVACLYPATFAQDPSKTCETPSCLYCYPRLMNTLFKVPEVGDSYYLTVGKPARLALSSMAFVATAFFESVLFASTIVFAFTVVYIAIDAFTSLWQTGNSVWGYWSNHPPNQSMYSAWNQCITSVKELMPKLGDGDGLT